MFEPKWLKTMEVYDDYERRFAEARTKKKLSFPTDEAARQEISDRVKKMLAYREELVPTVHNFTELSRTDFGTYDVILCRYETWEHCYVTANLYMPHGEGKVPLVFQFCGHGKEGRLTPSYRLMAHRLAENGFAVICPDNLGQGDREMMGHTYAYEPFACGLTLQGMIIMESVALIRCMQKHPRVDASRMGSCGNSGGGTLNLLLCAAAPELSAIAATGYPSEFHYLLSKERRHCACNLLPGCANGALEMWEILCAFAPRPLMIEQGENDHLIPVDYFYRTARKVNYVYRTLGAPENFRHVITKEGHPWAEADVKVIAQFMANSFDMKCEISGEDPRDSYNWEDWHVSLPEDARTTAEVAEAISGIHPPEGVQLWELFPPQLNGERIDPETVMPDIGRGETMRIWAQMESALRED